MLNVRLGAAILALVLTLTTGLTPGPPWPPPPRRSTAT